MKRLIWEDGELERFGEYVETLEIAADYLRRESAARTRHALITLDNLGEVLMYEIAETTFERDAFHAKLFPARFTRAYKSKVRWGFNDKVELLDCEQILPAQDGHILRILHRIRKPAFHRFDYNPRAAWVIAARAVPVVSNLLGHVFGGMSVGGLRDWPSWVTKYGLPSGLLNFTAASLQIGKELTGQLALTSDDLRSALVGDLETRLTTLNKAIADHLYSPGCAELDEILRHQEFWDQFDDDRAAQEYRDLVYIITTKQGTPDRAEFQRREAAYRERVKQALVSFRGTMTGAGLQGLAEAVPAITAASTDAEALATYTDLDAQLERYEYAVSDSAVSIDQAAELESDIQRGK